MDLGSGISVFLFFLTASTSTVSFHHNNHDHCVACTNFILSAGALVAVVAGSGIGGNGPVVINANRRRHNRVAVAAVFSQSMIHPRPNQHYNQLIASVQCDDELAFDYWSLALSLSPPLAVRNDEQYPSKLMMQMRNRESVLSR